MIFIKESEAPSEVIGPPYKRIIRHLSAPWTTGSKNVWIGTSSVDPGYTSNEHFHDGNVIMSAGIAALELLDTTAIEHINSLGERLQCGINKAFETAGISGFATRAGSLLNVHWTNKPVTDAIDVVMWKKQASDLPRMFHMELLNRGVFFGNRGLFNISTPMTTTDIDQTVEKIGDTLMYLKPYVQEKAPHLIR